MRLMLAAAAALFCTAAQADTVSNAYTLCKFMDGAGMASAPCKVSGWNKTVTATIDMNSGEARKLCAQVAGMMRQQKLPFDAGWTMQIKSPYSGGNSIAFCNL